MERHLTSERVAFYVAKYATKSTEAFGPDLARPIRLGAEIDVIARRVTPHVARLLHACWQLGDRRELKGLRLRKWAHQLGFGGHWQTKSRRYSTTFRALRAARSQHARQQHGTLPLDQDPAAAPAVIVLASWTFKGRGYQSRAERRLALEAAARARQQRHHARDHTDHTEVPAARVA